MTALSPLWFTWDGEHMVPLSPEVAARQYVTGEHYYLAHRDERSVATHNHEFAWLTEAWRNLPETVSGLYPTPEHLRKRALIETGYYDEEIIDCASRSAALRVAAFARQHDDFAYVVTRGPLVVVRTAKSQSRRSMDRREFAQSKDAIMDLIAQLLGTTPAALERERAA